MAVFIITHKPKNKTTYRILRIKDRYSILYNLTCIR